MRKTSAILLGLILIFGSSKFACADLGWFKKTFRNLTEQGPSSITEMKLSDTKIGQGLKEALRVGIDNAVTKTSQLNGYYQNDDIRLQLPQKLNRLEKGLRMVGFDKELDEFVLSMNRAAEAAAPRAREIFLNSLFDMTIDDAQKIYRGDSNAATEYFRKSSYDQLYQSFRPSVEQSLKKYDVTAKYQTLLDKYQTLPLARKFPAPSIDDYVVNKSLDGLFSVLAEEEHKIRTDPKARVNDLLKEVFN